MRRTLLLTTLAAGLCAGQAQAAPTVGVEKAAFATFRVTTATQQVFDVRVLASLPDVNAGTGTPKVRVVVLTADGKRSLHSATLPASAVSVTDAGASLTTRIGSLPLSVTWTTEDYVVAASFGDAAGEGTSVAGFVAAGNGARASVQLGSARCTDTTGIVGRALGHDTGEYGAPLAQALRGLSGKGLRCADVPSEPVP